MQRMCQTCNFKSVYPGSAYCSRSCADSKPKTYANQGTVLCQVPSCNKPAFYSLNKNNQPIFSLGCGLKHRNYCLVNNIGFHK